MKLFEFRNHETRENVCANEAIPFLALTNAIASSKASKAVVF